MNKFLPIILGLALLLVLFISFRIFVSLTMGNGQRTRSALAKPSTLNSIQVRHSNLQSFAVGPTRISVELAKTQAEQQKGLGGRAMLASDSGMLFPFAFKSRPSFWMKDMQIPLDFIWIANQKVVDITENVPPPKSPTDTLPSYQPKVAIDSVLEVNAGFVKANGIKIGDKATFLAGL